MTVALSAVLVVWRAAWGCVLTSCFRRPQCAIKDNDEGLLFGAAGDDGDYDEGTDAAKAHLHIFL